MSVARPLQGELQLPPRRVTRAGPRHLLRKLGRDRVASAGALSLLVLVLCGALAPILSSADPTATNLPERLLPPGAAGQDAAVHPLGTDSLGRDVLIRILYGARISLTIGFAAALIAIAVGVPLGLLSGYFGGATDALIMRLADIQLGFPTLLLYISVLVVVQPGLEKMIVVLGVAGWVVYGRVVRAQTLALRQREFVEAARSIGASHARIVLRHILPNVVAPVIVIASFSVATFIITASSLSFLGLGLPPATPDWGIMIADSIRYIRIAWWPSTFAGLALSLTVFGVNVLGDWLRDYLDPRLRMEY